MRRVVGGRQRRGRGTVLTTSGIGGSVGAPEGGGSSIWSSLDVTSQASSAGGASPVCGRAVTPLDEGGPNGCALGMARGDEAGGAEARSATQGAACGAAGANRPVEEADAIGRGGRWIALERFCGGTCGTGGLGGAGAGR